MSDEAVGSNSNAGWEPDRQIRLKVKMLPNATHDVEVGRNSRVEELKRVLENLTNIRVDRQRLIFRGRVLNNEDVLAERGIDDGHVLHLVERPADAPPPQNNQAPSGNQQQQTQTGTARISVNLGSGTGGLPDIGRMLQGVLRSLNVEGVPAVGMQMGNNQNPPTAGAGVNRTGTAPRPPPAVEDVPHLLSALNSYIQRLEQGSLPTRTLPVVSLHPTSQSQDPPLAMNFTSEINALTSALCEILRNQELAPELQTQLSAANEAVSQTGGQAASNSANAGNTGNMDNQTGNPPVNGGDGQGSGGGSVGSVRFNRQYGNALVGNAVAYDRLPLLVVALGHLVRQANNLFRDRASRSLTNAYQQLLGATYVDESNQELLAGGLRQIASVLHWYGALFVELSRAASAAVFAMEGNVAPLAANTPSVIRPDGSLPNFRTFFPRGLEDNQDESVMGDRAGTAALPRGGLGQWTPFPHMLRGNRPHLQPSTQRTPIGSGQGLDQLLQSVGVVTAVTSDAGPSTSGPSGGVSVTPVVDRVDVAVIEPSGQVYAASAQGQEGTTASGTPVHPPNAGGEAGGANSYAATLGPIMQQIAGGVMQSLGNQGNQGQQGGQPPPNIMQAIVDALRNPGAAQQPPSQMSTSAPPPSVSAPQPAVPTPSAPLLPTHPQPPASTQLRPEPPHITVSVSQSGQRPPTSQQAGRVVVGRPSGAPAGMGVSLLGVRRGGRRGAERPPGQGRGERPVGQGLGSRTGQPTLPERSPGQAGGVAASSAAPPPVSTSATTPPQGMDMGSVLNSMASILGGGGEGAGGGSGGGLGQLMQSMASSPAIRRMAEDPNIQRIVEDVAGDSSEPQDLGSLMNRMLPQMMPMMGQLLSGGAGAGAGPQNPQSQSIAGPTQSHVEMGENCLDEELSPEEAARWKRILESDTVAQSDMQTVSTFSDVYNAGGSLGESNGLLGWGQGEEDASGEEDD